MTTKIPVELSSTPSIVDNGDATAITIDSSENVGIGVTTPFSQTQITETGWSSGAPYGTVLTVMMFFFNMNNSISRCKNLSV